MNAAKALCVVFLVGWGTRTSGAAGAAGAAGYAPGSTRRFDDGTASNNFGDAAPDHDFFSDHKDLLSPPKDLLETPKDLTETPEDLVETPKGLLDSDHKSEDFEDEQQAEEVEAGEPGGPGGPGGPGEPRDTAALGEQADLALAQHLSGTDVLGVHRPARPAPPAPPALQQHPGPVRNTYRGPPQPHNSNLEYGGPVAQPEYAYRYGVNDPNTKDMKSAWELRDGEDTRGGYSVMEPNGNLRVVEYTVTKHGGFNARVKYLPPNSY